MKYNLSKYFKVYSKTLFRQIKIEYLIVEVQYSMHDTMRSYTVDWMVMV